jgi:hypothetical protein
MSVAALGKEWAKSLRLAKTEWPAAVVRVGSREEVNG